MAAGAPEVIVGNESGGVGLLRVGGSVSIGMNGGVTRYVAMGGAGGNGVFESSNSVSSTSSCFFSANNGDLRLYPGTKSGIIVKAATGSVIVGNDPSPADISIFKIGGMFTSNRANYGWGGTSRADSLLDINGSGGNNGRLVSIHGSGANQSLLELYGYSGSTFFAVAKKRCSKAGLPDVVIGNDPTLPSDPAPAGTSRGRCVARKSWSP